MSHVNACLPELYGLRKIYLFCKICYDKNKKKGVDCIFLFDILIVCFVIYNIKYNNIFSKHNRDLT